MSALRAPLVALCAFALVAGCTSPDRFDGTGPSGAGGAGSGDYAWSGEALSGGDPSNPASPAYFRETVGDRVLFAVDESRISAEARAVLDAQIVWLTANPAVNVVIEGHADEQGTRDYNLALGARRAGAVMEYMIASGIAPERLRTVTFGKERPVALCSSESCYAQNRRAVSVLTATGLSS